MGVVQSIIAYVQNLWDQSAPPKPTFTERELHDLTGKVFIVTGGASGVGKELAKILYGKNGTVYIAGRSEENGSTAVKEIKAATSTSGGRLEFLHLDLGDLTTIKKSAEEFMSREQRLDVLWNNAGVMIPPDGSKTAQGYELQIGTNCVGPYLFTQSLLPVLKKTAASATTGSVRVCWAGSSVVDLMAPRYGMDLDDLWYTKGGKKEYKYTQSKCGNFFICSEFAKAVQNDGIISVAFNPGNLKTPLQRHVPDWQRKIVNAMLYDPIYGAYTELFAGLSPEVTPAKSGSYIIPWGRFHNFPTRQDIMKSVKSEAEGGTGRAKKFYEWCDEQSRQYA